MILISIVCEVLFFVFSSRRRHTRCALVTGVQTCALPISSPMTRCVLLNLTVELAYFVDPPSQYVQLALETSKRNKDMALTLPELPYARDALAPHMSADRTRVE